MNSIAASDTSPAATRLSRRVQLTAGGLLAASVAYALAAAALLPHRLRLADAADVFIAGAVLGLMVTVLLWLARPRTFDRPPAPHPGRLEHLWSGLGRPAVAHRAQTVNAGL